MAASSDQRTAWYAQTAAEVASALDVNPEVGLSSVEASTRLQKHGANLLDPGKKETKLQAFVRQYNDFMQFMLLAAAAINLLVTGGWGLTLVLLLLTVFNAVLGMRGEAQAQASLASLQQMMRNIARVRRDGQAIEIDASEIVPGDVVLVEAGNVIPADGRIAIAANLEIEEAALTGESTATAKQVEALAASEEVPLGDRTNMVFMNTSVTRGRGEIVVTSTGMDTEMGNIASMLNAIEPDKTPLQKQMDNLVVRVAMLAGIAFVLMFLLGIWNHLEYRAIFVAGIALAIAAIPTSMPAAVNTMYALGTIALAKQNAIVKQLPSVETLGSVSAICSDKTGTLTLNKMTARELIIPGVSSYKVSGEGYSTEGHLRNDGGATVDLRPFILPMALCADARLDGENLIGDPTEGALIVLAEKGGIDVEAARKRFPRIAEIPFDSDYKYMATFHRMEKRDGTPVVRAFVKGAPDVLIARASHFFTAKGEIIPITEPLRQRAIDENARMAAAGERVMVVGAREFAPEEFDPAGDLFSGMQELILLAMVGIVDPPRPEAKGAIAECKNAGIRVRMITGDHATTAAAIGKELGIEGNTLTGAQFAAMSDADLLQKLPEIGIVARVAPEDKIRMVRLLQEQHNTVAMTGDGVNDAPALKKADIGVAMGVTGTEVSKGAAVMILTDDNFATIVNAVAGGRAIYDNLSKYLRFQMIGLLAFILCYLGATLINVNNGVPFSAMVVLWINFMVQAPLAILLGLGSASPHLMKEKPRSPDTPVISNRQWVYFAVLGLLIAVFTLGLLKFYEANGLAIGSTMAFVGFSLLSVAIALTSRSKLESTFDLAFLDNPQRLGLLVFSLLSIFLPTVLDFLKGPMGLATLTLNQWLFCIGLALALILFEEVHKSYLRRTAVTSN